MDRKIEKKKGWKKFFSRKSLPYWATGLALLSLAGLLSSVPVSSLRVERSGLNICEVWRGEFNDYVRVNGQVKPSMVIQISPVEGGRVEEIYREEGSLVKKGESILRLSNENLDLQILNAEAELAEKENILRNTLISMEQQKLNVQQERLQLEMEAVRARRHCLQQETLHEEALIATEDFLKAEEDYRLVLGKLALVKNREKQDSLFRSVEIARMEESLENMRRNMRMIRERKENLTIKAPIDGELGLLEAVLGQSVASGQKIGQLNMRGNYKIEARIDEHYIDRVFPGLEARFERQDGIFSAEVRKVYPEVRDGKFQADFRFSGEHPENIRAGQTYYLNLQLGQPEEAVLIERGNFYQSTGGRWIYVLSANGKEALKREIRIGRQNPQYYEVLDGLEPGESVIVSGYERFGGKEKLILR